MQRVRVGVVGCGVIAQIMHLPFLHELRQHFEIAAVCDLSFGLANYVGDRYGVHARYTDHRDLVTLRDVDAVAVLTNDHHDIVLDALSNGKHVLVEKPLAYNLDQADSIIQAAREQDVVLLVGYMKRYDPGFERALESLQVMRNNVQLIRIHVMGAAREGGYPVQMGGMHTLAAYHDVTQAAQERINRATDQSLGHAVGCDDPMLLRAYRILLLVCCHDSNIMRAAFGEPQGVAFTDIYRQGDGIVSVLRYGDGARCLWEVGGWLGPEARPWWDEHLTAYGPDRSVQVVFPHSYVKYAPTMLYIRHFDRGAVVDSAILTSYEEAFRREWLHFYDCVVNGCRPRTSAEDARADIALLGEMVKASQSGPYRGWLNGKPTP